MIEDGDAEDERQLAQDTSHAARRDQSAACEVARRSPKRMRMSGDSSSGRARAEGAREAVEEPARGTEETRVVSRMEGW
jgi:hypothetical protein